jgi:hypothetical protein
MFGLTRMSIYATHWILKFPRYGDAHWGCEWVEVCGQGVPAHIGTPTPGHGYESGDPYAGFLPPAMPVADEEDLTALRAMVIVRRGTRKNVQQYEDPLLVLSGEEYDRIPFGELYRRICDALRGDRPRCVLETMRGDGSKSVIFEDGSTFELPRTMD